MGTLCSKSSDEVVVGASQRSGDNRHIEVGKMSMKERLAARDALEAKRREKVVEELNEAKFISYDEENVPPPPGGVRVTPLDHPTSAKDDVRSQDFSQAPPSGLLEPLPSESDVHPLPFEPEAKIEEEEEAGTKIFNPSERAQPSESPSPPEPCESAGDQTTLDTERENASPPAVRVISEKSASPSWDLPDGVVIACVPPAMDAEEGGNSRRDDAKRENTPADVLPSSSSSPLFSSAPHPEDVDAPSAEMAVLLREKTTLGSSFTASGRVSAAEFTENAAPVVEEQKEASLANTEKKGEEEEDMSEEEERETTKEQDGGETGVEASASQEEKGSTPAALHWDPQGTRESTPKANHHDEEEEAVKSEEREEEDATPLLEGTEVAADEPEGSEEMERDAKAEKHSSVVPTTAAEEVRPSSADDLDRQGSSLISLPEEAEEDDEEEFPFSPPFAPAETGEAEEVHRQDWEGRHPEEEVVSREDSEALEPASCEGPLSPLLVPEEATEKGDDFYLEGEKEENEPHFATPQDESVSREVERSPSPASVTPPEAPLEAVPGNAPHFRGPVLPPSPSPASEAATGSGTFFSFRDQWNGDNDESRGEEAPQKYGLAPPSVEPPLPRRQPPPPPSLSSEDE